MRRIVSVGLAMLLSLLLAVPGAASMPAARGQEQEPTPQFRTAVEVVRVQVRVYDEDGDFVSGLGRADFELILDGRPSRIIDVLEMDSSRLVRAERSVDAPPIAGERQPLPLGARRQFLIFFDLMAPSVGGLRNARAAAVRFVEDVVRPEDRLGLAMYTGGSGLQLVVPFTADHEQVRRILQDLPIGRGIRGVDPALSGIPIDEIAAALGGDMEELIREVEDSRFALSAEQMTVALRDLGRALAVAQGRKEVLFFSAGLPDGVLTSEGFTREMERATSALRAADTVVHTLQPENMRGSDVHDIRNMGSSLNLNDISGSVGRTFVNRSFLYDLSGETGGEAYWFRHRLRRGLEAVEEAARRYYVIAFQTPGTDTEAASLEVRTSRPDLVVRAPERLALPHTLGALTDVQRQLRVAEALELGSERNDLALVVAGMPLAPEGDRWPLAVALQIPGSELAVLAGERGDDTVDLEILGLAVAADGAIHDFFRGSATARASGIANVATLRYVNVVRVPAGAYHLKLLVREAGTDTMSVRSLRFDAAREVAGGLRLYGPLPVAPAADAPFVWARRGAPAAGDGDAEEPGSGATALAYPFRIGEVEVAPDLADMVVRGTAREFYLAVDGLVPHPVTGVADWRLQVEAIGEGGRVRGIPDAEIVLVDDDGDATRRRVLVRVPFPSVLAFGPNELRFRAMDRVTGASVEGVWTFSLLPG